MASRSQLLSILGFVEDGTYDLAEALAALAGIEIEVPVAAATSLVLLSIWLFSFIESEVSEMACVNTHSTKVQGAGLCCTAVQSGLLTPPAPGVILPQYAPGQAATLPPGRITQVTDAGGHCASCMIVGSSSKKHPGKPVLKFIRGGPTCPSSGTGCCTTTGLTI
jgi:hypothetical protein